MSEENLDLQQRLARLEQWVGWLVEREQAREAAATPAAAARVPAARPAPPPAPRPVPPPLPRKPARPFNPTVAVAAAGAGIFLLGAVFFLHMAIQRGWIGPEMRFLLGLAVGFGISMGAARLLLGNSRKVGAWLLLAGLGSLLFTLRWGAFDYHFYPPPMGFAGTALAVLAAGGLAARAKSGGALCVALAAGYLAPLAFSQGGHHEVAMAVYLAVLMAATVAVPYLTGLGARWNGARWLAVAGTWALLAAACFEVRGEDAGLLLGLLLLHLALALVWIWLPRQQEAKPGTPTLLWFLVVLASTGLGWILWKNLRWTPEWFAGPVLLMAAANLALVKPLRERLQGRQADLGLLVLAAGHLALAVPIALDWQWVGSLWGLFALGLAWAGHYADEHPDWDKEEVRALLLLALGLVAIATLRWGFHFLGLYSRGNPLPFLNRIFLESGLAALAWGLLARRGGAIGVLSLVALEVVANLSFAVEAGRLVRWAGGSYWAGSIAFTLVFASSGALQWLRSLAEQGPLLRRVLAVAGYAWLGIASVKLLVADLATADTALKALVFLAVGGIFLAAALLANRVRLGRKEAE